MSHGRPGFGVDIAGFGAEIEGGMQIRILPSPTAVLAVDGNSALTEGGKNVNSTNSSIE